MKIGKPKIRVAKKNRPGVRERLLMVAIALFSAGGYDGVTVDEIVEKARVNKRMVYHYFGGKEAIYQEALKEVYGRLTGVELAGVDADKPVDQVLEALVRVYFSFLADNPEFVQLLLWENLARGRHLDVAGEALSKAPILGVLQQVVKRGIREGRIGKGFEVRHLLINLIGLCLIYFSNRYTLSRSVGLDLNSPKVLEEGIVQIITLLRHGILARGAGSRG